MKKFLATAGLAIVLGLSACGPFVDKEAQYKVAARELAADMAQVNSMDGKTWPTINPNSQAVGEAHDFARLFKAFLIHIVDDRHGYRDGVTALHLERVVDASAMAAPGALDQAHKTIDQGKALVARYRALNDQRIADLRRDMAAANLDQQVVKAFEDGVTRSQAQGGGVAQVFGYETQVLEEYGRTVDDLQRARRHWRASGKKFVFDNDGDLMSFQAHMSALQSVAMQERVTGMNVQRDEAGHVDDLRREGE